MRTRFLSRPLLLASGSVMLVVASLGAPVAPGAQEERPAAPARPACATGAPSPTGAQSTTIHGTLRSADPTVRPPRRYLESALEEIARRFTLHPSAVPTYGEVGFTIHRDGSASGARTLTVGMQRELAESALRAIEAAGAVRALGELPPELALDSLAVKLGLDPLPDSTAPSRPLARLSLRSAQDRIRSESEVSRPARARDGNPFPEYPEVARRRGVEGYVLMQFVVDEDGWAIPETMRLLEANYREFAQAVVKVLPALRFHPAELNGCPVKQLVQMPFHFTLSR